jgi:hypothetical protein
MFVNCTVFSAEGDVVEVQPMGSQKRKQRGK